MIPALRNERGFTLIELMVAVSIGTIVVLAAFALLDVSITLTGKVNDRVDSAERARLGMEQIGRELRSQVCPSGKAALLYADPYKVSFYAYTGTGLTIRPVIHTIAWNTGANTIVDSSFASAGTPPNLTYPGYTANPQTPTTTQTLINNVQPEPGNVPVFAYYGFTTSAPISPTVALTNNPLLAADLAQTSRIAIKFAVRPSGRGTGSKEGTTMESDVLSRTWDPNGSTGATPPQCI